MNVGSAGNGFGDGNPLEQGPLRAYARTLRQHIRFVVAVVVVCLGAAAAVVATSPKRYTAHADMLITPVPATETSVLGLGLLRQATDPSGGLSTAAALIDNAQVAARAQSNLHFSGSAAALLGKVSVEPVASSSIVEISATASTGRQAQRLANGFAQAAVQVRTTALHRALAPAIASLQGQIKNVASGQRTAATLAGAQPLYQQLVLLQSLASAPDPTIQFETPAALPTGASSPKTKLVLLAGLLGGLLIGVAGAFILGALGPRRTQESELELTGLPVLARVPSLGRGGRMRDAFDESFSSLRTMLRFATDDDGIRTIAVTSASAQEGKTTVSLQFALTSVEAGQDVLLVEADPFRPGLRNLVDFDDREAPGLVEYLSGSADLEEIVLETAVPGLRFIHAGLGLPSGVTRLLESDRGHSLSTKLAGLADVVIFDCPPVGPRSDAILIASAMDAALIVINLQDSGQREVFETVRKLRRAQANLIGLVLNRDNTMAQTYEHYGPRTTVETRPGNALRRARAPRGYGDEDGPPPTDDVRPRAQEIEPPRDVKARTGAGSTRRSRS